MSQRVILMSSVGWVVGVVVAVGFDVAVGFGFAFPLVATTVGTLGGGVVADG
jgi:hypothetical protein